MNPAVVVIVSAALASAVAVGVVHLVPPASSTAQTETPVERVGMSSRVEEALGQIVNRLDRLEQRVERASAMRQATPAVVDEPTDAPAKLKPQDAAAATAAADEKAEAPLTVEIKAAVKKLSEGKLTWEQEHAIWSKLPADRQDELLRAMEEYAKQFPNSAEAQNDLGEAYVHRLMNGDMTVMMTLGPKAEKSFDRALEIDDHHWGARFNKAMSLANQPDFLGRRPEAIQHFQVLMTQQEQVAPDSKSHPATYLFLGNLYAQQGKADKAKEVWQRGLKRFPTDEGLKGRLKK